MKITQVFILSLPNFYDTSDEKKKALVLQQVTKHIYGGRKWQ